MAAGEPGVGQDNIGDEVFAIGSDNVTVADLAALPADPAQLRARLLERYTGISTEAGRAPSVTSGMIMEMPVTPAVRSAAFRLLADLPGIRVVPTSAG